jgi:hypothetical protein
MSRLKKPLILKKQKSVSLVEVHLLFDLLIEFYQLVSLYDTKITGVYKNGVRTSERSQEAYGLFRELSQHTFV